MFLADNSSSFNFGCSWRDAEDAGAAPKEMKGITSMGRLAQNIILRITLFLFLIDF